jgi:hypothetical protein
MILCRVKLRILTTSSIFVIQIFKIIGCTFETFSEWIFDKEILTYSFIDYLHEDGITIWYNFTHVLAHIFNSYKQHKNPIP